MDRDQGDRRSSERRKLFRTAFIVFEGQRWPMPCVLLDLSEGGARLNMPTEEFPDEFQLCVESEAIARRCRVVWRKGEEAGVQFIGG